MWRRPDVNLDVNPDVHMWRRPDVNPGVHMWRWPDVNPDVHMWRWPDVNPDVHMWRRPDVNPDVNQDVHMWRSPDVNPDVHMWRSPDVNPDVNPDVDMWRRPDVNPDVDMWRRPDVFSLVLSAANKQMLPVYTGSCTPSARRWSCEVCFHVVWTEMVWRHVSVDGGGLETCFCGCSLSVNKAQHLMSITFKHLLLHRLYRAAGNIWSPDEWEEADVDWEAVASVLRSIFTFRCPHKNTMYKMKWLLWKISNNKKAFSVKVLLFGLCWKVSYRPPKGLDVV